MVRPRSLGCRLDATGAGASHSRRQRTHGGPRHLGQADDDQHPDPQGRHDLHLSPAVGVALRPPAPGTSAG